MASGPSPSFSALAPKNPNMKTKQNKPTTARERRWVLFNNGCIHGITGLGTKD
jgi:hypothetical protein